VTGNTTTRQDDGNGRHNDSKGQHGDGRQDDGDGRHHGNGKDQQGDMRYDDDDGVGVYIVQMYRTVDGWTVDRLHLEVPFC